MTYKELCAKARRMVADYPEKKTEICDIVEMCLDEIESGGSEIHEVELALEDLGEIENATGEGE